MKFTGEVQASDILATIREGNAVLAQKATIVGELDFTTLPAGVVLMRRDTRYTVKAPVVFMVCTFKGKVVAERPGEQDSVGGITRFHDELQFQKCTFEQGAHFRGAEFDRQVNFYQSEFLGDANFQGARFGHPARFSDVKFFDEARFENAVFNDDVSFLRATFDANALFQRVRFRGEAQFGGITAGGYTDFGSILAQDNFLLSQSKISGFLKLNNAQFQARAEFISMNSTEKPVEMRNATFEGRVSYQDATVPEGLMLEGSRFLAGKPETENLRAGDKSSTENTTYSTLTPYSLP